MKKEDSIIVFGLQFFSLDIFVPPRFAGAFLVVLLFSNVPMLFAYEFDLDSSWSNLM